MSDARLAVGQRDAVLMVVSFQMRRDEREFAAAIEKETIDSALQPVPFFEQTPVVLDEFRPLRQTEREQQGHDIHRRIVEADEVVACGGRAQQSAVETGL